MPRLVEAFDATVTATMTAPAPAPAAPGWVVPGSSTYRRIGAALFLAGLSTFSLLYCVQPLLPALAHDFDVSPTQSSLALSISTGLLAIAILLAGAVSQSIGRRGLMFASMCAASVLDMSAAAAPTWHWMLALRGLEGLALGGVPAVAMAYLAEEIDPRGLGLAMGLYVGGTAAGGMLGRVGIGFMTEWTSWRIAVGTLGAVCLLSAIGFRMLLPPSRHFVRRAGFDPRFHVDAWLKHLRRPGLAWLFLISFVTMGAFISIYNYAGFRLIAPPYSLSHGAIGLIFTAYLLGMAASSTAGAMADRLGRATVMRAGLLTLALGLGLTLLQPLAGVIAGIAVMTIGFFTVHSVASGWVGRLAITDKGHATSLYLLAYYLGSSLIGSTGGWFWTAGGWPAVTAFAAALAVVAWMAAWRLDLVTRTTGFNDPPPKQASSP